MKIRKVGVRRYKSLCNIEMADVGDLAVLIGENGSGKSNLFEALNLFFLNFGATENSTLNLTDDHWHRKDTRFPMEFELELELSDNELTKIIGPKLLKLVPEKQKKRLLMVKVSRSLNREGKWTTLHLVFGNAGLTDGKSAKPTIDLIRKLGVKLPHYLIELEVTQNDKSHPARYLLVVGKQKKGYWVDEDFRTLAEDGIIKIRKGRTNDPSAWAKENGIDLQNAQGNLATLGIDNTQDILDRFVTMVRNSFKIIVPTCAGPGQRLLIEQDMMQETQQMALRKDYKTEDEWKSLRTDFESVYRGTLTTKGIELLVDEEGRTYQLESMGSGHQSWLRLLMSLRTSALIIAIEEPEAHSHPSLSRTTFSFIKQRIDTLQLFIATHSPIFVDREDKENNWLVEFDGAESHIYRLEDFKEALEAIGAKPSDRFMPESVLLVEGQSDKAFLEGCAKKMNVDMGKLLIVPVHGKGNLRRNLDAWVPVARGTRIRLHALLDRDAQCMVNGLVRRGVLDVGDYSLLDCEIEDLYPKDLVKKAMEDLFSIEVDPTDPFHPPRKDHLEQILTDKKVDLEDWNVRLAEYVGMNIPKGDIPPPVVNLLKAMKE